ncbi:MAG: glycosyltransferase family 39 protein [Candidatus Altiarchaeia archaeon]
MFSSDDDVLRILEEKKEYQEIKHALNVKKKTDHELRGNLERLERRGKINRIKTDGKEYYERTQEEGQLISKKLEVLLAAVIILSFTLVYANLYVSLKQIPGPLYGGDYYLHYGIINHIYNGNAPWTCSEYQDQYAFHPWLLHLTVALIGKITGNLLASFLFYFPVLVVIASGLLYYLIGRELFKERAFALLLCLGGMGTRLSVDYIPANYTPAVTSLLLFYTVFKALKTGKTKWIASGGIAFGLFIMSHIAALAPGALLFAVLFAYYSFTRNVKIDLDPDSMKMRLQIDREKLWISLVKTSKILIPMAIIGFGIGLLYWGPVFFSYKFQVKNAWGDYAEDYALYGGTMAKETILGYLFNIEPLLKTINIDTCRAFIISLLTLTGLVDVIRDRKEMSGSFMALTFATGLIGSLHYMVTLIFLNATYSPARIDTFILAPAAFILMFYGMYTLYRFLKADTGKKVFIGCIVLFLLSLTYDKILGDYTNQWTKLGQSPENPATAAMASWIKENTDKNAVFLSTEELSFALNGLTGRKLVVDRRTHSNPYVDINERLADASVMLYGNNEEKTLQLLAAYNVSYVYWDSVWPTLAEREPMLVQPKYAEYLTKYGVKYQAVTTYLDPAWSKRFKKYGMLMVIPAKNEPMQPWSNELNKHLTLVKGIDIEGQAAYRIYKVG